MVQVGQETFRLCQQVVDGLVLVDNRAVSAAIKVGAIAIMLPETAHVTHHAELMWDRSAVRSACVLCLRIYVRTGGTGLPSLTHAALPWPPTQILALLSCPDMAAALQDVFNETRSILEPAGAVAVAGAKAYLKHHNIQVGPCTACQEGFSAAAFHEIRCRRGQHVSGPRGTLSTFRQCLLGTQCVPPAAACTAYLTACSSIPLL